MGLNIDHPVKTSGPQKSRIEDVGTVGGRNDDYFFAGGKAVHFDQQGVQGLAPLLLAADLA